MATQLEQIAAQWPTGSWSIGQNGNGGTSRRWSATVHGHGTCQFGNGDTPEEAFDKARSNFLKVYPDELTAKRKQLEDARRDVERLEADLAGAATAA